MKWLKSKLMGNYMLRRLFTFKGNARACLWPEPLWGVPYNLYLPYVSLFMTALGMTPAEIGYVTSISMVSQVIFALLSGVLCDKLGRRKTTFFFDMLSWSVPEFIWMFSRNFYWFAFAAVFNGAWRVTENSWSLLLIEDMDEEDIMPAFSLTQMLGLFSAFFAPLSKFAVEAFGLVPTMRTLYGITFVSMTVKFILVYVFSTETQVGMRRMAATKNRSMLSLLWECRKVYLRTIANKRMLLTFGILAAYSLWNNLHTNYWALYVCSEIGISEGNVVLFATLKSLVTLRICHRAQAAQPLAAPGNSLWPCARRRCVCAAARLLGRGSRCGACGQLRAGSDGAGHPLSHDQLAPVHQRRAGGTRACMRHDLCDDLPDRCGVPQHHRQFRDDLPAHSVYDRHVALCADCAADDDPQPHAGAGIRELTCFFVQPLAGKQSMRVE